MRLREPEPGGSVTVSFIIRRIIQSFIVVLGVTLVVFLLFQFVPNGAVGLARIDLGSRANQLQIHQFILANGFNLPWWDQYWHLLDNYAHLNFGYSYHFNQSVRALIGEFLPRSLVLVGMSTVLALIVAVPLGIFQTVRRNKPSDYALSSLAFIFYAMPAFVLGNLLILYLAVDNHVFAPLVPSSEGIAQMFTDWHVMTLPVITLAALTIAAFSRYMRSSMMDALAEDYVRTARAKGAGRIRVLFRHALRNALIPIITLLGLSLPAIVSGAVITETVFNFPGMGYLTYRAATQFDVYVVVGTTIVATVATVVGSLAADLLYAVADPRIRYVRN
ncbi:MAG: ABC transporter permease [Acidimicrobiales bacterium]